MSVYHLTRDAETYEPTEMAMLDHLLNSGTGRWSCPHTVLPGNQQLVNEHLLCAWRALDYPDTIKDRNARDLTEAEAIKKRWQEYTE